MSEDAYTVEQVARKLQLHENTIRNMIKTGRLRAVKIGKGWRIPKAEYEKLLEGTK